MIKRLLLIAILGVTLSGCFVAPLALIGPATSGFSTASIIQAGVSSGANYMVKKSTGSKCPRCWKILQGKCVRCDQATDGATS